jgi:endoglucanase
VPKCACHGLLYAALLLASVARADEPPCQPWPQWQEFRRLYLSEDGRVVDASTPQALTVSEGQAYALTFALIANDKSSFERVLQWTRNNLAAGNLGHSLPAWKWGRGTDGRWGILDRNSAADADLWMAYTLAQAGRLWNTPGYGQLAQVLATLVAREEVALIPGLGATLLPGPRGFVTLGTWRLNASYVPVQVLRGLAEHDGQWSAVLESARRTIVGSAPHGFAADWIQYRQSDGFSTDRETAGAGSYNAIRVYLWAGMLPEDEPQAAVLAQLLKPAAVAAARQPPAESIDTNTLEARGQGPAGFLAALLPLLTHFKFSDAVQVYRQRIEAESLKDNQHYYSDVLTLFGLGWTEGRYRFDRRGELHVNWSGSCRVS